jgi:hypothetical protein
MLGDDNGVGNEVGMARMLVLKNQYFEIIKDLCSEFF